MKQGDLYKNTRQRDLVEFDHSDQHFNFYHWHETAINDISRMEKYIESKDLKQQKQQSKGFPQVLIQGENIVLPAKHEIHPKLYPTTKGAFHIEVFNHNLFQPYSKMPMLSSEEDPKKSGKTQLLECLGFLRTGKDLRVEYQGMDELKRLRMASILHIMDYVLQDRERVFSNDMLQIDERDKDRVTLDNVFDIAKGQESDGDEESEDEDEENEEEQAEEV